MKIPARLRLFPRLFFAPLFLLIFASPGHLLHAQNAGALDPTFTDAGLPADAYVQNILPLANGQIYVTGSNILLYSTGGQYSNFIRLNADGSLDTAFNPFGGGTFQAYPLSLVTQSTGQILIDSVFQVGNRTSGSEVARFNADGTYDPTFTSSPGFSEYQVKMLVQPNDKIILVGSVSYNNVNGSIARLNADGSFDSSLQLTEFYDYEGDTAFPQLAMLQSDGRIIIAGRFYYLNGGNRNGVARLNSDGTLDPTFDIGDSATPDSNRIISAAALQADGGVLIGGSIDLPGQSFGLARLSSTGAVDPGFMTGTGFTAASGYPTIDSIVVQADGKILVGGIFDHYNGVARNNLARLNKDGSLDTTFDAGAGSSGGDEGGVILTFASDAAGRLLVGGDFTTFEGAVHNGIVRLAGSSTGTALTATTFQVDGSANPSAITPGAALAFTATQGAAASSGVFVRVQATSTPTIESSWTDLMDTTNGGAGFLKGDGRGNYSLTTTQYPLGAAIYFRVISAATGQTDSISNVVGPFALASAVSPLTATTFEINGKTQPFPVKAGAPLTFSATQGAAAGSGVYVRVQATATPNAESSWTDLTDTTNGGAGFLKGDGNGNYSLTTNQYPSGPAISFRVISASPGQMDSISNIIGAFALTNAKTPILSIDQTASTADDPHANVAIVGDLITYTFTVRNSGTAPATNVQVLDILGTTLHFKDSDIGYLYSSGKVTFKFPQIAAGKTVAFKLIAAVTADAPLGSVVNNRDYNLQADGLKAIQGADINSTTIIPPLEVTVSGAGAKVVPGQKLTYTIAVNNRTPGQIQGIELALPLPAKAKYISSGFFNAAGTPIAAPQPPTGGANPELNGGSTLFFYVGALAPKKITYLHLVVQIPVDVDPVADIVLPGAKVTTTTEVGGENSFTLPDIDTPLSGAAPAAAPQLTFSKLPIDAIDLEQSIGAQKAEAAKLLAAIKAAAKANPAFIAEFIKIYPGLASLKSLSAPVADFAAALDPDVSYDDADAGAGQLTNITVDAPTVSSPTYIAFVLPYANSGQDMLSDVIIQDQVPTGTSIYAAGTSTYNGSVIINGALGNPSSGGNLEIANQGRTLRFHLGDVGPGAEGFVIYKVRVLAKGETGAPSFGAVLATSGSVLSSTSLSHTYIGQPDGRDITVVGPYDYYLESNQPSSNTALLSEAVVYEIYYQNTGSRASAILDIDDPIPAGLQYVTTQLFDANHHQISNAPASAVDVPSDHTNGTLVFHPAKFTKSGTVAPGAGGYIRVYFAPLAATHNGFVHSPFIPKSSFATKGSIHRGSTTRAETLYGPVTRGAAATAPENAASMTRVDESGLSKLFIALAMPMTMVEGSPSEIFLVGGSLNDVPVNDVAAGTLTMILPKGVQYEPLNEFGTDYASYQTSQTSGGLTELRINFVNGLPAHGAAIAKFVVQPRVGTASKAAVVFPGCTLTLGPSTPFSLQTGPINVRVMTAAEAASLSALRGQVASVILNTANPSDPLLAEFISHITAASRTIVVAGASGVSSNNGSILVQLQGTPGNVLAMGPIGSVGAQGQAKSTLTKDFDFICATGAAADITTGSAPGLHGATLPPQSAQALLDKVTSAVPGNGVKIGALSLLNGGGSNLIGEDGSSLIGQDGSGLIGQDGSGLTGQTSTADLALSGVSLGTGVGNASLISQDGGGLVSNASGTLVAANVISNDGGSAISTQGGNVLSGSGASGVISNDGGSALPTGDARPAGDPKTRLQAGQIVNATAAGTSGPVQVGTPDQTAVFHATPAGVLIQVGSTTGLFQDSPGD